MNYVDAAIIMEWRVDAACDGSLGGRKRCTKCLPGRDNIEKGNDFDV